MATFSTNQNRQFYVANAYSATVNSSSNEGTLGDFTAINTGVGKEVYFLYQGANKETVMRSDIIPVDNTVYAKAVKAIDMATPLKVVEVTMDSSVNSGAPISGQDYILRINFRQFYGMSDQDQYFKDIAVHATAAMTDAEDLFTAMVAAANQAFSREVGATASSNPYLTFAVSGSGSSAKLVITEKPQEWTLGTQTQEKVYFDVYPTTVYYSSDDYIWGVVTNATPAKASWVVGTNAVGNGKKIADLEYFCMGERGDQYRNIGWPNNIPTKYLVDASAQYDVFEIHYSFKDTGVNSYKSEKDITIVMPQQLSSGNVVFTNINALIAAFNTATGLSVATLS